MNLTAETGPILTTVAEAAAGMFDILPDIDGFVCPSCGARHQHTSGVAVDLSGHDGECGPRWNRSSYWNVTIVCPSCGHPAAVRVLDYTDCGPCD